LGVTNRSTPQEITAAFRKLAQMYHPDKVESLAPEYREIARRKMLEINVAYDSLMRRR
jgi:DnaJ like chaperone protein